MRAVLFDIDETLLHTGGAGRAALTLSVSKVIGKFEMPLGFSAAGKTDPMAIKELLESAHISDEEIDAKCKAVLGVYPATLSDVISQYDVAPCPGVSELLQALQKEARLILGVFTGNIKSGADIKLKAAGLSEIAFRFGAYGDEAPNKQLLLPIALERANIIVGTIIEHQNAIVIGDSPIDIVSGKLLGLRTVGVATGPASIAKLLEQNPDYVLKDLSDWSHVQDLLNKI